MDSKKFILYSAVRTVVQAAIRRERRGWPPDTPGGYYQPRRPERPLVKAAEEKKP